MSLLPVGISGEEAGYQIERSVRLNSPDSAYFSRTPASAGNRKTWTWSGWVKRSALPASGYYSLFGADSGSGASFYFAFDNSTQQIEFGQGATVYRKTTQVFRDPSAWYHVFLSLDTTQATANDRVKVYINGAQVTAFGTTNNPTQNADLAWNSNVAHSIGADIPNTGARNYFNGYLTEINFIDGSALDPTSFGEFNTDTGVWQPKAYTGSYGTNGFYLNFSDNSGVTSTTLGADSSGNGNNWTPNNFSVTAGAGNDSLVDTPTNYGTDTGVGGEVRGNYATFNALQLGSSTTLNNGNLDSAATASSWNTVIGTMFVSSGKWYAEVTVLDVSADYSSKRVGIGIIKDTGTEQGSYLGSSANGYGYFANATRFNNATSASYGATYLTNDVIGIAMDLDAGTLVFYKNNTSQGTAYSGLSGAFSFAASHFGSGAKVAINFGQRPFAYTAPSGFKALCTQNLPEPTIVDGGEYFNTVLWTGTGSGTTRAITGVGFQPDWVWAKARSQAYSHGLYDVIRGGGANSELQSNSTAAEGGGNNDEYGYLSSFDSDGFTSTAGTQGAANNLYFNQSGATYVAWNWKANGAGVSNTAGTITSTVSANTDSGFSIVTYTGTGANATVGHGLGIAPSMMIFHRRNTGGTDWIIYHSTLGATKNLAFDTAAAITSSTRFNDTAPTSTVFTLGTTVAVNGSADTYVAYCFAAIPGYSAFGSYTGNGSADGPFVYTGFRPAFVMIKQSSASGEGWYIVDTARDTYNAMGTILIANDSGADNTSQYPYIDYVSNGFKLRKNWAGVNGSGSTYIYMAFAETPFSLSLAR